MFRVPLTLLAGILVSFTPVASAVCAPPVCVEPTADGARVRVVDGPAAVSTSTVVWTSASTQSVHAGSCSDLVFPGLISWYGACADSRGVCPIVGVCMGARLGAQSAGAHADALGTGGAASHDAERTGVYAGRTMNGRPVNDARVYRDGGDVGGGTHQEGSASGAGFVLDLAAEVDVPAANATTRVCGAVGTVMGGVLVPCFDALRPTPPPPPEHMIEQLLRFIDENSPCDPMRRPICEIPPIHL